ncbi:isocitrate/isopropylmalate dehydrogenase family protein [Bacillus vallismortis]|uniref:Isocitrate/isopropylmalate family dehydrogenase n=1 Tax=Bacillus vallismortis TaxID=72361 RepID=A0AAP3FWU4_BACVA|nr:isocitrate/isopropylmalate family dehydrogenase [Bacillus vallismortis]MCI3985923.1 isocitrate/isopropylmalate family dehydrogenase [Bacillus vallismortis]MCY8318455.1 isocitrate/isopropylmalate family dehydrogenase [Bacillus vallismortis]MCY8424621.1 isocitrate/isopropylmalate family dehydrogenase [Bacillus vallismortis]MCY8533258.1 isocitrate/isopropylmalate family dehydrogenase [Bacillus vallismortis]MCY8545351.1 isocitrate/isopropylmalate family dehydrogenase [Bacillus vallismortis]
MAKLTAAVLPGDGIGPEVIECSLPVFDRLGVDIDLKFGDIGWEFWKKEGDPVPQRTWDLIDKCDVTLLGAITSKPHAQGLKELDPSLQGQDLKYVSPVIQLRQKLQLFANVRPAYSLDHQHSKKFRMTVIRENTEGLYAGLDFSPIPKDLYDFIQANKNGLNNWQLDGEEDGGAAIRLITKNGVRRLLKFAFEWAKKYNYQRVTWSDKPNVMRQSGQFALTILEEVAKDYPEVDWEVQNVDATAMWMVKDPGHFGVIVSENQFGDILSDLGAGIMGGLGLAPSSNFGYENAYFEPVHGSAPKHAGKMKVNPMAQFLTISLLLEHCGFMEESMRIKNAVNKVLKEGKTLTYDLGGIASTKETANAIIENC